MTSISNGESGASVRSKLNTLFSDVAGIEAINLKDVATLTADTTLTYTAGQDGTVASGDIIRTRKEGFSYQVAASGASDHHLTTAGGVKLYVQPGEGGYSVAAVGNDFSVAASIGGRWNVPAGTYALSSTVSIATPIEFVGCGDASVINFTLGGAYSAFDIRSDHVRFSDLTIDINHTSAPSHGGIGNIFQMGDYSSVSVQEQEDITIERCRLSKSGTYSTHTTVIGIFNKYHGVRIRDIVISGGSSGIIAHWSGDFDIAFPDTSSATVTWHPYDIDIENVVCEGGLLPISLASVYDARVRKVTVSDCTNGVYVLCGDFTNTLATSSQVGKIGKGVTCRDFHIENCSGVAVRVVGYGARAGTASVLSQAETSLENFTIASGASTGSSNAVFLDKCYGVTINNPQITGYDAGNAISILHGRNIQIDGGGDRRAAMCLRCRCEKPYNTRDKPSRGRHGVGRRCEV